jgi:hypothetical protein
MRARGEMPAQAREAHRKVCVCVCLCMYVHVYVYEGKGRDACTGERDT